MSIVSQITGEVVNRGWSLYESAFRRRSEVIWEVRGERKEHTVVARSPYQVFTLKMAAAQIVKLRKYFMQERLREWAQQVEAATDDADRQRLVKQMAALEHELELDRIFRHELLR